MTVNAKDQFGHGVSCPFQRDGKGDFAHTGGLSCLQSDIGELIGIIGPTVRQPGEVPWRCSLGSRILKLKHRHLHGALMEAQAQQETSQVVRVWEPRVRVGPTTVERTTDTDDKNALYIRFRYMPTGSNNKRPEEVVIPVAKE